LIETHGQDARATTPLEQLARENKTFMDSSTKHTKSTAETPKTEMLKTGKPPG
jgi:hypothetical protein